MTARSVGNVECHPYPLKTGCFVTEEQLNVKSSFRMLDGVDGETRLTRYMSLPTFLLLLGGRVFIPTLVKLRETDRLESNVPESALGDYWKITREMLAAAPVRDSLLTLAGVQGELRSLVSRENPITKETMGFLIDIWIRQLASRRCVWCWNKEPEESQAIWRIYGNKGIAVVSSVKRIAQSLKIPDTASYSVSEVFYVPNPMTRRR